MHAYSLAFLPHTVRWQMACHSDVAALLAGSMIGSWAATALAAMGLTGAALTVV